MAIEASRNVRISLTLRVFLPHFYLDVFLNCKPELHRKHYDVKLVLECYSEFAILNLNISVVVIVDELCDKICTDNLCGCKPESIVEKTGKVLSSAVKKLMTPEEEDEEAAYDRAEDLVRPGLETRRNVENHARTTKGHVV